VRRPAVHGAPVTHMSLSRETPRGGGRCRACGAGTCRVCGSGAFDDWCVW